MIEARAKQLAALVRELVTTSGDTPVQFAQRLGYTDQTAVFNYKRHGPAPSALPRLARIAHELGRPDIAEGFTEAFLDEYPDLRTVLARRSKASTQDTPFESRWRPDLETKLQSLLALGSDPICRWVSRFMTMALEQAPVYLEVEEAESKDEARSQSIGKDSAGGAEPGS